MRNIGLNRCLGSPTSVACAPVLRVFGCIDAFKIKIARPGTARSIGVTFQRSGCPGTYLEAQQGKLRLAFVNSLPVFSGQLNCGHGSVLCSCWLSTCILVAFRYRIINQLVDFRYEAARVAEVKRRFLRLDQCIPLDGFLTGWFLGAPIESILRGNVEDFVAYGFYSRYMHQLPPHVSTSLASSAH